MRLKLASRKSDLARWQAVQVAKALESTSPQLSIEFQFKASLGDQNLDLPLASLGSKGVFTEDFFADLSTGVCDLVVHSWKDLPVEERPTTEIALTLPRADVRDLLLVPESVWQSAVREGRLTVLTSSPRRVYNLSTALPDLLPADVKLEFRNVRGNVPTRLGKMHSEKAALVLAKAGLDRLLEAENEKFLSDGLSLREKIRDCRFMVLPLSVNPGAPAQGALAIEIARGREDLKEIMRPLNQVTDMNCVRDERQILAAHGGGCHQKIGVTVLHRSYGQVRSVRGLTDAGEVLQEWQILNSVPWSRAESAQHVFPQRAQDNGWFERKALVTPTDLEQRPALLVARAEAWPVNFVPSRSQILWTAGVQTWRRLASQGLWVNGTCDGLGEREVTGLETLLGVSSLRWSKLTHREGATTSDIEILPTYELHPRRDGPDLRGKTHFFWMSASSFERARQLFPDEVNNGFHACGPGHTYGHLQAVSGLRHSPKVFAGLEQFLSATL